MEVGGKTHVEGHEVVDLGFDGFELGFVFECPIDRRHRRLKIGLRKPYQSQFFSNS